MATRVRTVALTGDPEKDYLNAIKQEQSAKAAVKDAEKALETKGKEITPIVKTGAELLTLRTKRADEVKAAEEAAQAARQAAEAKAKALEDAKKAQADWEAANGPKLAAYDKASNDFKALEEALAIKRQQAEDATRAVAAADAARRDLTVKAQKEKEEAAKRLAAQKAEEDAAREGEERARPKDRRRNRQPPPHPGETSVGEDPSRRAAARLARCARGPHSAVATPGPVAGPTPRGLPVATPGPVVGRRRVGFRRRRPRRSRCRKPACQNEFGTPAVPLVPATPTNVAMHPDPRHLLASTGYALSLPRRLRRSR